MYEIYTANSKTEKRLRDYVTKRNDVRNKLDRLKLNPRKEIGTHPLHGRLKGKWGGWLGSNIRIIFSINEEKKIIIIEQVGSHKIY